VIAIAAMPSANTGAPVTLTAQVTDDGLPKPRVPVERKPTAADATRIQAQANSSTVARPRGLGVTWMQLRGPARVALEPSGFIPVADGKAAVTARFSERGTYVLRATASDGSLSTTADLTISVGGAATADPR
jgi:hypothetical protein